MTDKLERRYFVAAGRGTHVAIDTTALCDASLSWKARALHYYIRTQLEALSNQQELVDAGPDGRDAVATGIKELIQHRYLYAKQHRDENGQFVCMIYISFPEPVHTTQEELSTLMGTGSVHMSTQNVPMSPPHTENPETVRSGQDVMYYLTSLSINTNNKSLRDLSYSIKPRTAGRTPDGNFSQQKIEEIFNLWNSLPALPTHKKNPKYKKYTTCLRALKYALRTHEPEIIMGAMREYNTLLASPHTVVSGKKAPMRIGLDEFFVFGTYTQAVVGKLKVGSPMHGIVSWFNECKKGSVYLLEKYSRVLKNKHPEVVRVLEVELEMSTSWKAPPDSAWDKNSFIRAAGMVVAYLEKHRAHLPHDYTPVDLAVDLINMVCDFKNPHPGALTNEHTWEAFGRYLLDMGIIAGYEREAHHGFAATASL